MIKSFKIKNFFCIKEQELNFDKYKKSIDLKSGYGRTTVLRFLLLLKEITINDFQNVNLSKWRTFLNNKDTSSFEVNYFVNNKEYIYKGVFDFNVKINNTSLLYNHEQKLNFFKEENLYQKTDDGNKKIISRVGDSIDYIDEENLEEHEINQIKMIRVNGMQSIISFSEQYSFNVHTGLKDLFVLFKNMQFYKKEDYEINDYYNFNHHVLAKSIYEKEDKINELLEFLKLNNSSLENIKVFKGMDSTGDDIYSCQFIFQYDEGEVKCYYNDLSKSLKNIYKLYDDFFNLFNMTNNIYFIDNINSDFSLDVIEYLICKNDYNHNQLIFS